MHSMQSAILFYDFCPSVRPSVSPSVYCVSTRIVTLWHSSIVASFQFFSPNAATKWKTFAGTLITRRWKNCDFFTEIAVYLGNGTRIKVWITNRKSIASRVGSSDLEWLCKAGFDRHIFSLGYARTNACRPRTTKFGTVTHVAAIILLVSHLSIGISLNPTTYMRSPLSRSKVKVTVTQLCVHGDQNRWEGNFTGWPGIGLEKLECEKCDDDGICIRLDTLSALNGWTDGQNC